MIIGLGSDLVDMRRIAKVDRAPRRAFPRPHLHPAERAKAERRANRVETYAKRFAAKEACAKALGTGLRRGVFWRDMGVVNLPSGRPDHEADRRRAGAAAGDHAARLRGPDRCFADRRRPAGAGHRHHFGRARSAARKTLHGLERQESSIRQTAYAMLSAIFIACRMSAATRSPGRVCRMAGREADERDIRNKTERRRRCRNSPRDYSCADHRAGDPHLPVPAVQYSVRLDEGDAAGRRLPVRVEIHLRLQPIFVAVVAAAVFRARLPAAGCPSAATSSCSACRRILRPITSSA